MINHSGKNSYEKNRRQDTYWHDAPWDRGYKDRERSNYSGYGNEDLRTYRDHGQNYRNSYEETEGRGLRGRHGSRGGYYEDGARDQDRYSKYYDDIDYREKDRRGIDSQSWDYEQEARGRHRSNNRSSWDNYYEDGAEGRNRYSSNYNDDRYLSRPKAQRRGTESRWNWDFEEDARQGRRHNSRSSWDGYYEDDDRSRGRYNSRYDDDYYPLTRKADRRSTELRSNWDYEEDEGLGRRSTRSSWDGYYEEEAGDRGRYSNHYEAKRHPISRGTQRRGSESRWDYEGGAGRSRRRSDDDYYQAENSSRGRYNSRYDAEPLVKSRETVKRANQSHWDTEIGAGRGQRNAWNSYYEAEDRGHDRYSSRYDDGYNPISRAGRHERESHRSYEKDSGRDSRSNRDEYYKTADKKRDRVSYFDWDYDLISRKKPASSLRNLDEIETKKTRKM